jgi:hypothetical protein
MTTYYENSNDRKVRDILDSKRSNECIDFTIMSFFVPVTTFWSSKYALIFNFDEGFC